MKKLTLLILAVLMVIGLCSCNEQSHRKLQFDDGTSYCFNKAVNITDDYISIGVGSRAEYYSIIGRTFIITYCDCENINK